jgi:pilus assembly protein CpaB
MKRGRIVVLGIAFTAAVGAALIARHLISSPAPVRTVEKTVGATEVLVAAKPIQLGESVNVDDLKWQQWPKDGVTPELITNTSDPTALDKFAGSLARAPLIAGEPISPQKLIKPQSGGVLAAILPSGMRAVSTPITEESAAGGFILPDDRVDVILSRDMDVGSKQQRVSETVLRDVRVLAIGQDLESKGDQKTADGKTATLELSPHQVEVLVLAQSMGQLSLSLRSLADTRKSNEPTADIDNSDNGTVKVLKYGMPSRVFGVN